MTIAAHPLDVHCRPNVPRGDLLAADPAVGHPPAIPERDGEAAGRPPLFLEELAVKVRRSCQSM
eukprot:824545-Lingulodinium_polyedra.AAC.1